MGKLAQLTQNLNLTGVSDTRKTISNGFYFSTWYGPCWVERHSVNGMKVSGSVHCACSPSLLLQSKRWKYAFCSELEGAVSDVSPPATADIGYELPGCGGRPRGTMEGEMAESGEVMCFS